MYEINTKLNKTKGFVYMRLHLIYYLRHTRKLYSLSTTNVTRNMLLLLQYPNDNRVSSCIDSNNYCTTRTDVRRFMPSFSVVNRHESGSIQSSTVINFYVFTFQFFKYTHEAAGTQATLELRGRLCSGSI